MSPVQGLPEGSLAMLDHAITLRRAFIPARRRPLVRELLAEAVVASCDLRDEGAEGDVGVRACDAAALLLELGYERLNPTIRTDLAQTAGLVALSLA
jgi:hypothetical protein